MSEALELLSEDMAPFGFSFFYIFFLSVWRLLNCLRPREKSVPSSLSSSEKTSSLVPRVRESLSVSLRFLFSSAMTLWVLCQVRGPPV